MAEIQDFLRVFGHISVFFATLDFMTTEAILRLVDEGITDPKLKMNDRMTLAQKFRIIEYLEASQVTDPAVLLSLKQFMPQALQVGETRNRFIHDQWVFAAESLAAGKITRVRLTGLENGRIQMQSEETTLDNLRFFLGQIGEIQQRLGAALSQLPVKDSRS